MSQRRSASPSAVAARLRKRGVEGLTVRRPLSSRTCTVTADRTDPEGPALIAAAVEALESAGFCTSPAIVPPVTSVWVYGR